MTSPFKPESWDVHLQPADEAMMLDVLSAHRDDVRRILRVAVGCYALHPIVEAMVTKTEPVIGRKSRTELWIHKGAGPVSMPTRCDLPVGPNGGYLTVGTLVVLSQPQPDVEVAPMDAMQDVLADLNRGIELNPGVEFDRNRELGGQAGSKSR